MGKRYVITCDKCGQDIRDVEYEAIYHSGEDYAFHPGCLNTIPARVLLLKLGIPTYTEETEK